MGRNGAELTRREFMGMAVAGAAAGLGLPLLAACGGSSLPTTSGGVTQASLRFNWTIKGEFTPFVVAREKGFYKDEKVDLQLQEGKSGTQVVQVVGSGRDQFGYVPSIQVVEGVNKGVPLMGVATLGRNNGMCWASWPGVPLTGPESLYGHRVSISSSSTFFQIWPAFQRHFHLDASKIAVVNPDPSARVGLFLDHQLDIMADIFYANDYVILQNRTKQPLNLLKLSDLRFDPLGYLLVVNKSLLSSNRDVVQRVVRATLRGFQYTIDHPDEAVAIMSRLYAQRLGAAVIKGQVQNMIPLIIREPALGQATAQMWDDSLDLMVNAGVIQKKLPLDQYYTDAYVQQAQP
jgi:NitT/TauT family transport system substrate-binding protein